MWPNPIPRLPALSIETRITYMALHSALFPLSDTSASDYAVRVQGAGLKFPEKVENLNSRIKSYAVPMRSTTCHGRTVLSAAEPCCFALVREICQNYKLQLLESLVSSRPRGIAGGS